RDQRLELIDAPSRVAEQRQLPQVVEQPRRPLLAAARTRTERAHASGEPWRLCVHEPARLGIPERPRLALHPRQALTDEIIQPGVELIEPGEDIVLALLRAPALGRDIDRLVYPRPSSRRLPLLRGAALLEPARHP